MLRAMLVIGLLVAVGCGDGSTAVPVRTCSTLGLDSCQPIGGFGGHGGAGGETGAGGFGGEGGAGGVGGVPGMFTFYIPDVDCWFWRPGCDPALPSGMSFNNSNPDLTYLEGGWWTFRGEGIAPDGPPILPERVEICVRKEYENRQVIKVVGACFDAEYSVILDGQGLSFLVGGGVFGSETWWFQEIRLYYEP